MFGEVARLLRCSCAPEVGRARDDAHVLRSAEATHDEPRVDEWADADREVVEVASATADAVGQDRVAIRLSPFSTFNDLPPARRGRSTVPTLARALRGLLYVHLVTSASEEFSATAAAIRDAFGGPVMHNGGFDAGRAEVVIAEKRAELVSFGRPFIANPDLVARMKSGASLAAPDPSTFYTPGARGYVDYSPL